MKLPKDLKRAILILDDMNIGDYAYDVRGRESSDWDSPKVLAWSEAASTIAKYAKEIQSDITGKLQSSACPRVVRRT